MNSLELEHFLELYEATDNIFLFAKNHRSQYVFGNEILAEAAGADSPQQLIGKEDIDLKWRDQAPKFVSGDVAVLNGHPHVNVRELQYQCTGVKLICTTKLLTKSHSTGESLIIGSFHIEEHISRDSVSISKTLAEDIRAQPFADILDRLTRKEIDTLTLLVNGFTAKQISSRLDITSHTVQFHLNNIKIKLGCHSKPELVELCYRSRLTYHLTLIGNNLGFSSR
ncbi:helix-turn-helix transcriptional regulator [Ketobacter nezhaii]|uniref:helix-turn-helix transcriptional regulator n=1 Tax=Ketobacter sp. MCCC 1A13808 TaxID=2602738 RepID=UPI0018DC7919|nr:helix-turn-helix transcriptional regulator [Ketobacter sp. MCCC 1A13808]